MKPLSTRKAVLARQQRKIFTESGAILRATRKAAILSCYEEIMIEQQYHANRNHLMDELASILIEDGLYAVPAGNVDRNSQTHSDVRWSIVRHFWREAARRENLELDAKHQIPLRGQHHHWWNWCAAVGWKTTTRRFT